MTREEFVSNYGIAPERAKQILEELRHIVNQEVRETIAHADYYIDPRSYGYEGELEKKDVDDDGYTCLYDFGNLSGGEYVVSIRMHKGNTPVLLALDQELKGKDGRYSIGKIKL